MITLNVMLSDGQDCTAAVRGAIATMAAEGGGWLRLSCAARALLSGQIDVPPGRWRISGSGAELTALECRRGSGFSGDWAHANQYEVSWQMDGLTLAAADVLTCGVSLVGKATNPINEPMACFRDLVFRPVGHTAPNCYFETGLRLENINNARIDNVTCHADPARLRPGTKGIYLLGTSTDCLMTAVRVWNVETGVRVAGDCQGTCFEGGNVVMVAYGFWLEASPPALEPSPGRCVSNWATIRGSHINATLRGVYGKDWKQLTISDNLIYRFDTNAGFIGVDLFGVCEEAHVHDNKVLVTDPTTPGNGYHVDSRVVSLHDNLAEGCATAVWLGPNSRQIYGRNQERNCGTPLLNQGQQNLVKVLT